MGKVLGRLQWSTVGQEVTQPVLLTNSERGLVKLGELNIGNEGATRLDQGLLQVGAVYLVHMEQRGNQAAEMAFDLVWRH